MLTYINPINVILFILMWGWFVAGYATFAAMCDTPDGEDKNIELWLKFLMLSACLLAWPYPIVYKLYLYLPTK